MQQALNALPPPSLPASPSVAAGLLTTLGLGEDAQLTRKEWSLLRASLGELLCWLVACEWSGWSTHTGGVLLALRPALSAHTTAAELCIADVFRTRPASPHPHVAAGKPRRLSLKFLKEERARLEHWREGCRQQYQSGAAALADAKVADHLPRPLAVGQVRLGVEVWRWGAHWPAADQPPRLLVSPSRKGQSAWGVWGRAIC